MLLYYETSYIVSLFVVRFGCVHKKLFLKVKDFNERSYSIKWKLHTLFNK